MALLWLIVIGAVLFGALLLFGVWKNRPRRIEIVAWIFICVFMFCVWWMSLNNTDLEEIAQTQFDDAMDFFDCFTEWVDQYSTNSMVAWNKMIECATNYVETTTKNIEKYQEYLDL